MLSLSYTCDSGSSQSFSFRLAPVTRSKCSLPSPALPGELCIENGAAVWRGKADRLEEGVAERSSLKRPRSAPFLLETHTTYKLNIKLRVCYEILPASFFFFFRSQPKHSASRVELE